MKITETERLYNTIIHEHTESIVFVSLSRPIEFTRYAQYPEISDTIKIMSASDNITLLRHNARASEVFRGILDTSVVSVVRFWERERKSSKTVSVRSVFFTFRNDLIYIDGEAEFTNDLLTLFYFKECTMTENTFSSPTYEYLRMFSSSGFLR
jgi:hypothetical protein